MSILDCSFKVDITLVGIQIKILLIFLCDKRWQFLLLEGNVMEECWLFLCCSAKHQGSPKLSLLIHKLCPSSAMTGQSTPFQLYNICYQPWTNELIEGCAGVMVNILLSPAWWNDIPISFSSIFAEIQTHSCCCHHLPFSFFKFIFATPSSNSGHWFIVSECPIISLYYLIWLLSHFPFCLLPLPSWMKTTFSLFLISFGHAMDMVLLKLLRSHTACPIVFG